MAAEDVLTKTPSLFTPVRHPEPQPTTNVTTPALLLPTPADAQGAASHVVLAGHITDDRREEGPSILIEFRTAELPKWKPRIIVDQRRISRDDD